MTYSAFLKCTPLKFQTYLELKFNRSLFDPEWRKSNPRVCPELAIFGRIINCYTNRGLFPFGTITIYLYRCHSLFQD